MSDHNNRRRVRIHRRRNIHWDDPEEEAGYEHVYGQGKSGTPNSKGHWVRFSGSTRGGSSSRSRSRSRSRRRRRRYAPRSSLSCLDGEDNRCPALKMEERIAFCLLADQTDGISNRSLAEERTLDALFSGVHTPRERERRQTRESDNMCLNIEGRANSQYYEIGNSSGGRRRIRKCEHGEIPQRCVDCDRRRPRQRSPSEGGRHGGYSCYDDDDPPRGRSISRGRRRKRDSSCSSCRCSECEGPSRWQRRGRSRNRSRSRGRRSTGRYDVDYDYDYGLGYDYGHTSGYYRPRSRRPRSRSRSRRSRRRSRKSSIVRNMERMARAQRRAASATRWLWKRHGS